MTRAEEGGLEAGRLQDFARRLSLSRCRRVGVRAAGRSPTGPSCWSAMNLAGALRDEQQRPEIRNASNFTTRPPGPFTPLETHAQTVLPSTACPVRWLGTSRARVLSNTFCS